MNQKRTIAIVAALVICGALFYFYAGHETPAGQPALAELASENFAALQTVFNAAKHETRVILLLSPT